MHVSDFRCQNLFTQNQKAVLHFLPRSLAVCQHIWLPLFLLVFSPTPVSAIEMMQEKLAFSEKKMSIPSKYSPDNKTSAFVKKHQNRSGGKDTKKRLINRIGVLGAMGSIFFAAKKTRLFLKKGRRGKNDNSSRRTIIGLILFAVTLIVVVGLLLAGATGEGGFIWLLVGPALAAMWLIYVASGKSRKSATSPTSD